MFRQIQSFAATVTSVFVLLIVTALSACGDDVPDSQINDAGTVDSFLQQEWTRLQVTPAEQCADDVFGRRVYLDLAGRIPTSQELATFVADERPDKRQQLIDLLLTSEDYVQHFADVFDTLLMGRTSERHYDERNKHQWRAYLERVFRENRPWNEVVAEILLARPKQQEDRGAVWFLFERNNKHQEIAEAVAPAFFGIHIECAQCHDHMMASEIEQAHYWGLVAFFNRSNNKQTKNGPRVEEFAVGGFSEFAGLEGDSYPNLLTFIQGSTIDEDRPASGDKPEDDDELYVDASLPGDPRVPKFSRRQKFVSEIATGHPLLARAFSNRIWAMIFGRGIVHPFDEMDSTHPPSHPELLDKLAVDFETSGFDIRQLVRTIVSSSAYGLNSVRPAGVEDPATFAWYLERALTAEQYARSVQLAVRGEFRNDDRVVKQTRQQLTEVMPKTQVTTIKEALFLTNNESLNNFINDSAEPQHLVPKLLQLSNDEERATELMQIVFGRKPTSDELSTLIDFIAKPDSTREKQLRLITWSMLTSAEFRFNH